MDKEMILKKHLAIWDKLTQEERKMIIDGSVINKFEKSTMVYKNESNCKGIMIILSGQLRVYLMSDEGREVTLYRINKNEMCILSASCLMDSIIFDVYIDAVDNTEVLLIPSALLHKIIAKNIYFELYLQKKANERFSDVMWTIQQILFTKIDKRIAIFLWDEMIKANSNVLQYTQEEIAKYIGSAREVVSRILKYFIEDGIVKVARGKIEIIDKNKLKKLI